MKIKQVWVLLLGGSLLWASSKADRAYLEVPRVIPALRVSSAVRVDGLLDDTAWQQATFQSNFVQRNPLAGENPTEKTEFAVLYDDEYVFVAIRAYDSQPDSITSILSRRDEMTPSDWVNVSFDSYDDHRTAFEFWLNPQGVKRDIRRFDDDSQDRNWDAIWEGKTNVDAFGWTAEFRIPLRELRFSSKQSQAWGLQVYRHISRKNEDNFWTYWSKDEGGWVRHYGRLTNLENIPRQRQIYVSPYSTGQYASSNLYRTALNPKTYRLGQNLGVDLKIGVTNNLTLDVTVNPDFGQVEADPAELNISAFESFFSEKRPFFVEGSNIYAFRLGFGDGGGSSTTLFYPRRIGRSPHFSAEDGVDADADIYDVDQPRATAILGAAKLTGKTASGWSIGILEALTTRVEAQITYADRPTENYVVEPLTNYFVTRLQKDLNAGRTSLGIIVTSVNRDLEGSLANTLFGYAQQDSELMKSSLRDRALSGGIDFRHRFKDDTYELEASLAGSSVRGSAGAILNAQTHPNRYFQRPGATHLSVDSTLTSLGGFYGKAVLSKIKGEHWVWTVGNLSFSPGFEANDLGFSRRVDNNNQFFWVQYRENDPGNVIRRWRVNFNGWSAFTFAGAEEMTELGGNVNAGITLLNYWQIYTGLNVSAPAVHTTALWGGPAMRRDATIGGGYWIGSDSRKAVSFSLNGNAGGQPESGVKWRGIRPNLTWRPTKFFTMRLSGSYNYMLDTWAAWGGYAPTPDLQTGAEHYIMAELERQTISTTLRVDLTLTPTLSIQFYGSPFVTAGTYSNDKIVNIDKAMADKFADRFTPITAEQRDYDQNPGTYDLDGDGITNVDMPGYWGNRDFNYKAFNSNLVVRWEYITGSSIFLVWSRNMSEFLDTGAFSAGQDLRGLFGLEGENIFLLKASYLLNI